MRILELFGGLIRRGGEEMFVYNVLKNFDADGVTFDCLVVEDCANDDFNELIEAQGGKIYELNIPLHATRFSNHIYKPVLAFLREHSYDIVHIHSSSIAALAVLASAAHRAGVPKVIVHSHSVGRSDSLEHKLFRTLAAISMRGHVDEYCACSRPAAQWKFAPKYAAKATIVKNGVDTARFSYSSAAREAVRAEWVIPDSAYVIGNVGRLCELKNQDFLISVFDIVCETIPDAWLMLVGDGEDGDKLRAKASESSRGDRIIFVGNVTNVQDYMSAMDVFAFPSAYEGLGIVAVEAQCSGLPVVASSGVPKEIELTDDLTFLTVEDTDESRREWAELLSGYCGRQRSDGCEAVRAAGYDIRSTVEQIKVLYGVRS